MKDSWAVVELTETQNRLIDHDLDEKEAKDKASKFNGIGDYTYVAIPLIIRTDNISTADLDNIYKRLRARLR